MRPNFSKPPPPYSSIPMANSGILTIANPWQRVVNAENEISCDHILNSTALYCINSYATMNDKSFNQHGMASKIYYSNSKISENLCETKMANMKISENSKYECVNNIMEDFKDLTNISFDGINKDIKSINCNQLFPDRTNNNGEKELIYDQLEKNPVNDDCLTMSSQLCSSHFENSQLSDYNLNLNYSLNPGMQLSNETRHNLHNFKTLTVLSPQETEAIAFRAARMVDMLSEENRALRKTIEQHSWKLSQIQKLEMDLEKTQKDHEILIFANEKRENLEKVLRSKMESEIKKLRNANQSLLESLQQTTHSYMANKQKLNTTKHGYKNQNNCENLNHKNSYSTGSLESITSELNKKDLVIRQLIAQNKDLISSNEKKDIETAAQRATLNEQSLQLEVMQKALIHAQSNILRLEEIVSLYLKDRYVSRPLSPFIKKLLKDQLLTSSLDINFPNNLDDVPNKGENRQTRIPINTVISSIMANRSDPTLYHDITPIDNTSPDRHLTFNHVQNYHRDNMSVSDNQLQYAKMGSSNNALQNTLPASSIMNLNKFGETAPSSEKLQDYKLITSEFDDGQSPISDYELLPRIKALQSCLLQKENLILDLIKKSNSESQHKILGSSVSYNMPLPYTTGNLPTSKSIAYHSTNNSCFGDSIKDVTTHLNISPPSFSSTSTKQIFSYPLDPLSHSINANMTVGQEAKLTLTSRPLSNYQNSRLNVLYSDTDDTHKLYNI